MQPRVFVHDKWLVNSWTLSYATKGICSRWVTSRLMHMVIRDQQYFFMMSDQSTDAHYHMQPRVFVQDEWPLNSCTWLYAINSISSWWVTNQLIHIIICNWGYSLMMNDWFIHSILKSSHWRQLQLGATVFRRTLLDHPRINWSYHGWLDQPIVNFASFIDVVR